MPDDRREAAARMVQHPGRHNLSEARGKGQRKGGEAAHRGGGYRGRKREAGAGEEERKTQRGEKVRRVGVVLVQLLARVYI